VAKPSGDHTPPGGFVRPTGDGSGLKQMISSKSQQRGPKLRAPKRSASPKDLATRFFELQQLREQVHDLEHSVAIEREQGSAPPDGPSGKK
jgi:hypothetical protein